MNAVVSTKSPGRTIRALKISAAALMRIALRLPEFQATTAHTTDTMPIAAFSNRSANGGASAPQSISGARKGRFAESDDGGQREARPNGRCGGR